MEQSTPNPKCTTCKCYWMPDQTDIKTSGLVFKTCKKCREISKKSHEKNKCVHDRGKSLCRECGGGSICVHDRQKSHCKECNGSSFCIHDKRKSTCKECGGSSICVHDRLKSACKDCKGGSICIHDRIKSTCKQCGGGSICIHNRIRSFCKECGGSSFCIHDRQKTQCKECGGSSFCIHGKRKSHCKECNFKLWLVNIQRKSLRRLFNNTDVVKKTKPSIEYLGCSAEYFIEHIEKQMKEGMIWDNIHLDHIKPVSKFNLDDGDEFLMCCNYKNFQPLMAEDNMTKHNKFSKEDEDAWIKRMNDLTI